jgi:hypothetical protein
MSGGFARNAPLHCASDRTQIGPSALVMQPSRSMLQNKLRQPGSALRMRCQLRPQVQHQAGL